MKKFNRLIGTAAAAAALLLIVTACSNSFTPQTPPAQPQNGGVSYSQEALATPLTLEACVANAVVTFVNKAAGPVTYKVNGGAVQTIASGAKGTITLAKSGDKVEFWGDNSSYATDYYGKYSHIACDKDCYVYGNIMSLVKSAHFEKATALEEGYTFTCFFINNTHIKNKSGADLLLPAATLADFCYYEMFQGCASLTAAPSLPATKLASQCYWEMFYGCASLTAASSLPAATLANYCYYQMFYGCTSLASVTCLATNISASDCTTNWLYGVAANGTFTKAAGTDWSGKTGASGIPSGWTVEEKQ